MDEHLNIIRRCLDGDARAQKEIFDLLCGKMLSLCLRYAGDRMLAEDLLQEGFVTLFTKLDTYKGDGSFEGWARRIFVTTCLMQLRRRDVLRQSEDLDQAGHVAGESVTAPQKLGYQELMGLICEMPDGYRAVFNLFVVEGFSHREISQMLGISEVTSRSQLNRAKAWLQQKIKENEV